MENIIRTTWQHQQIGSTILVVNEKQEKLAVVSSESENIDDLANAKLMAAAPDLLAMCELAIWVMKKNEKLEGMDFGVEIAGIQQAIDKATK